MQALYVMNSQSSVCVDVLVFVGAETWKTNQPAQLGGSISPSERWARPPEGKGRQ